eukprot:m.104908 g.104908  ORF g.104908 m.104908 type:complete len:51 (-) comp12621_c0_seq3:2367-2519(-)
MYITDICSTVPVCLVFSLEVLSLVCEGFGFSAFSRLSINVETQEIDLPKG